MSMPPTPVSFRQRPVLSPALLPNIVLLAMKLWHIENIAIHVHPIRVPRVSRTHSGGQQSESGFIQVQGVHNDGVIAGLIHRDVG